MKKTKLSPKLTTKNIDKAIKDFKEFIEEPDCEGTVAQIKSWDRGYRITLTDVLLVILASLLASMFIFSNERVQNLVNPILEICPIITN